MQDITTTEVHQFGSNILVELIGVDEHGDVATRTIEFECVDAARENLTPCGDLPAEYEETVRTALSESGYALTERVPS